MKQRPLRLSDELEQAIAALAEQHKRSFHSEVVWALEQYVNQQNRSDVQFWRSWEQSGRYILRKGNKMQYDSRDGNYHGTLPDGTEIIVDGDVYAEAEQGARKEGAKLDTIESPVTWENLADGETVRIVKK